MRRSHSSPSPVLRLLLVLSLLLGLLPTVALAAVTARPAAQETAAAADAPAVYVSELLPAADSVGRYITLVLETDGSATWGVNFLNGEPVPSETGTWTRDAAAGTLSVSLLGTDEIVYDAPVEFVFAEEADGSLTAVEWDETLYGSEAIVLFPATDTEYAGEYLSETLPAASSPGRDISFMLDYDGTATVTTDYLNGEEPVVELGTWSMSEDGVSMIISLTGGPNTVYEAPIEWTFAVEGDTLTATEWDETIYGSDVLVLERGADETVVGSPDGVWVSSILPAASSPGQVVLLILYADSTLQSSTWYLNNELPIIEDGTWANNGDGTVTLTVTGSTEREYDTPQELVFDFDGETLTYLSLQLTRLEAAESANGPQPLAFYTTEVGPAASSPGLQRSLIFYDDNSVQMVSDYLNGEDPIIEEGSWSENADGGLTVTLTGTSDESYAEPVVVDFELSDGTLTAVEWDEALFGSAGLAFTEQNLDDLVLEESAPVSGEANDLPEADSATTPTTTVETAPTSETITATVDSTATEPATGTEPTTETESATGTVPVTDTDSLLEAAAPFEAPEGAEAVYVSDVLPAASSPGRLVRLVLFVDGTAQEITDYLNGESPIVELGTWEESAAGEVLVTLTGRPLAEPYAEPIETTFAQTGETLTAVQWDETIYGSEPLTLTLVEGE